jgi:hypothetical protein
MDDLLARLENVAPQMNALRRSWFARPNYDLLADAIWWIDERPSFDEAEDHWCLQPVFRYRTTLILEKPDSRWQPFWERALKLFPNWPGFHRSRCSTNAKLAAFYKKQAKIGIDSVRDLFDAPELLDMLSEEPEE